jgi:hypothetical protein
MSNYQGKQEVLMVAIVGIIAVLILAVFLILFRLRPNAGAASSQKPHPTGSGPLRKDEPRSPGIN